jgi:hypothetical protein
MNRTITFAPLRAEGGLLHRGFFERLAREATSPSQAALIEASRYGFETHRALRAALDAQWNTLRDVWRSNEDVAARLDALWTALGQPLSPPDAEGLQETPSGLLVLVVAPGQRLEVAHGGQPSPHSRLQLALNRRPAHLWGVVTNGHQLRLLRDHHRLQQLAFVEWDLDAVLGGEVEHYPALCLLWLILHHSSTRYAGDDPAVCALETWHKLSASQGERALDRLRDSVKQAVELLLRGVLWHPRNAALRERVRTGALPRRDLYDQALHLIYRLIFLLITEQRDLLCARDSAERPRYEVYLKYYSVSSLLAYAQASAQRSQGHDKHHDRFSRLCTIMGAFAGVREAEDQPPRRSEAAVELGLPALNSPFWSHRFCPDLLEAHLSNHDLLAMLTALSSIETDSGERQSVDWEHVGAEELGSVYESLLEQHIAIRFADERDARPAVALETSAGNSRKLTGAYYTPASLVELLLESALDPVIKRALDALPAHASVEDRVQALLALTICDPSCGSGHFLLAAANRLAESVAALRAGERLPSPAELRQARREVIVRCIHGVDINPMAVELCKMSLWLEAMEPGKPLPFLEHKIQVGNALFGATPAAMRQPHHEKTFDALPGDRPAFAKAAAKVHKQGLRAMAQRQAGQQALDPHDPYERGLAEALAAINSPGAARRRQTHDDLDAVWRAERDWLAYTEHDGYKTARALADLWCAAFIWPLDAEAPSDLDEQEALKLVPHHANWSYSWLRDPATIPPPVTDTARALADRHKFFHWHLQFPHIFAASPTAPAPGWLGGFDVVLGNPPWDKLQLEPIQWFSERRPEIAQAANTAARNKLIKELEESGDPLFMQYQEANRAALGEAKAHHLTSVYPLCGQGNLNTYALFAELNRHLIAPRGYAGFIAPSGLATDFMLRFYFADLVDRRHLVSLYDFENRQGLFPTVDSRFKFSIITLANEERAQPARFVFFAQEARDVKDPARLITLTADDIARINPNSKTCPVFRSSRDAEITRAVYARLPVILHDGAAGGEDEDDEAADAPMDADRNPWGVKLTRMFDMSKDSHLFSTREQLEGQGAALVGNVFELRDGDAVIARWLPLYEAKMIHHYDHRWASFDAEMDDAAKADPSMLPLPRYWVAEAELDRKLAGRWARPWMLGWRDITRNTDERTILPAVLPLCATGHTLMHIFSSRPAAEQTLLVACMSSFAHDYIARQKINGTHASIGTVAQLPVVPPGVFEERREWTGEETVGEWVRRRVVELVYTAHDMAGFARECGFEGAPYGWDVERRAALRAELDAAMFHLYGMTREEVAYVMDTFPIVKRRDEQAHDGAYVTRDRILARYDALASGQGGR